MPLFIFMGLILSESGIGADLYIAARNWMGRVGGSLAMATSVACGFFAAVCGDSATTAVTMGKVAFPEMRKHKYDDGLSTGCIVAGGTIGILIPPSICMIIYGLITEQSIGKLFMAGFIPGVLQVVSYVVLIFLMCKKNPALGPAPEKPVPMKEKIRSLKGVWPVIFIFLVILIGMYGGFFTPVEAGAMGAVVSLLVSVISRRMNWKKFSAAITDACRNTAMIFFLLIGAYIFMRFMALSHLPSTLGTAVLTLNTNYHFPRLVILLIILVFYMIMGAFMDVFAIILLTLSIVFPIITSLGYNPIWFGVIMTRMMEMGMISPPFGLNLFVIAKTTKVPMQKVYKGIFPFIGADFIHLALLIAIPELSLWLPSLM
jgi:tripartite ATP-independent transporter DctM subunit